MLNQCKDEDIHLLELGEYRQNNPKNVNQLLIVLSSFFFINSGKDLCEEWFNGILIEITLARAHEDLFSNQYLKSI